MRRRRVPAPRRAGGLLAVGSVVGSLAMVRSGVADDLDRRVSTALSVPRGHVVDRVVGAATDLGSVYGLAGVALALAGTGRRRRARRLLAAGGAAWCVAQAAKPLADRPRPYEAALTQRLVAEPAGSSWPSGHAAVITAMALTLREGAPGVARAGIAATAVGVGCSRLYVGVHHPSDLIAGAGIGALCARAVAALGVGQETDSGSGRPTTER